MLIYVVTIVVLSGMPWHVRTNSTESGVKGGQEKGQYAGFVHIRRATLISSICMAFRVVEAASGVVSTSCNMWLTEVVA